MTVIANAILQVLGVIILFGNQVSSVVPEKYKALVTGVVSVAMGLTAILAHFRNPDGTKAEKAYNPDRVV